MTLAEQLRALQNRLDHNADRDVIIGVANDLGELAEKFEGGDAPSDDATEAPKAAKGKKR